MEGIKEDCEKLLVHIKNAREQWIGMAILMQG